MKRKLKTIKKNNKIFVKITLSADGFCFAFFSES